jgi:signal transduction histidine kinase
VINVVALTEDITDFRDARSLRKAHDAIRRVAETTADSALAERCRIAENLEGNTSQLVITLGNHLSRLRASSALNPAEKEALTQIISAAERFVSYLRPLAEILDPPTKVSAGLAKAVSDYARRFTMRTGIDVITDVSGDLLVVDPLLQATIVNAVKIGIAWLAEVSSGGLFLHVYREDTRILVLADGADAKILSGAAEPVGMVHLRHDLRDLGGFVDMKFTNGRCHFRGVIPLDR